MILRPYQLAAIGRCRDAYRRGSRSVVLVAPCGAGKTAVACEVARAHLDGAARRAVLSVVPRLELAAQMARAMRAEGLHVGVLAGDATVIGWAGMAEKLWYEEHGR